MKLEPIVGIYLIEHITSGKVYVGQSIDCYARAGQHMLQLRNGASTNPQLQAIYDRDGAINLHFEIVEECSKELLGVRETFWMRRFNKTDLMNVTIKGQRKKSRRKYPSIAETLRRMPR